MRFTEEQINNYIKNTFVEIIDEATIVGPLYTSNDVWGNEVIILKKEDKDRYTTIRHKLKTYKAEVEFSEEDIMNNKFFDRCVAAVKKQNEIMLDYENNSDNLYNLVCHQLCNWRTLQFDDIDKG